MSEVIAGYPKEKQVWLKPGDRLVSSIERLGELHFTLTLSHAFLRDRPALAQLTIGFKLPGRVLALADEVIE